MLTKQFKQRGIADIIETIQKNKDARDKKIKNAIFTTDKKIASRGAKECKG